MNRATETSKKRAIWGAALALSLILNLVLGFYYLAGKRWAQAGRPNAPDPKGPSVSDLAAARPPAPAAAAPWVWADLATLSFHSLHARLLESGCPEHTVRAILGVVIDREYRPRLAQLFARMQENFWDQQVVVKTSRPAPKTPEADAATHEFATLMREREQLRRALAEASRPNSSRDDPDPRLNFLTLEQQGRLQQQQEALRHLRQDLRAQGFDSADVEKEVEALKAQHAEERRQFLTPSELEQYGLRNSRFNYVVQDLYDFDISDQERKTIIQLHEAHDGRVPDGVLEEALGAERAAAYKRARDPAYAALCRVGDYLSLSPSQAQAVYALKLEVETRAKAIRSQPGLRAAERSAMLNGLQAETLAGLAKHFGPTGRDLYLKNGGWWVNQLGQAQH